jgi:hypothetical protein
MKAVHLTTNNPFLTSFEITVAWHVTADILTDIPQVIDGFFALSMVNLSYFCIGILFVYSCELPVKRLSYL